MNAATTPKPEILSLSLDLIFPHQISFFSLNTLNDEGESEHYGFRPVVDQDKFILVKFSSSLCTHVEESWANLPEQAPNMLLDIHVRGQRMAKHTPLLDRFIKWLEKSAKEIH